MRQQRSGFLMRAGLAAFAALGFLVPVAYGQGQAAVITGKITDDQGEPLIGASVQILNTNFGATTNVSGVYTLTISAGTARGQDAELVARAVGHRPKTVVVKLTPGSQTVDFQLAGDPLRLEEVVTTGTAAATQTHRLTFAVGKVTEEQLQVAPATTALGNLQGRVAGVEVFSSNGMPGTEPQIRLRGSTSITGSQTPLIVIDGTISYNALADISPEDIERVEVVKGAAASSLYGSNGANGVIQVFTRRGARLPEGKIQVTMRTEVGQSKVSKFPEVTQHHAYLLNADGSFYRRFQRGAGFAGDSVRVLRSVCSDALDAPQLPGGVCPTKIDIQDAEYPSFADAYNKVYEPGIFSTQYISVGQNRGRTNFSVSFQNTRNPGSVVNLKGQRRQNYRMNLDQVLHDKFDMSFSAFYGRNTTNEPSAGGDNGPFFSLAFIEPHVDPTACCNPDGTPYRAFIQDKRSNAANPLYDLYNVDRNRERNRFTGGVRARWRPVSWLIAEGNFNYDQLSEEYIEAEPVTYWSPSSKTGGFPGNYERSALNNRNFNTGVSLTGNWQYHGSGLMEDLGITVRTAASYEDVASHYLSASASEYIVKQVPEFTGTKPEGQRAFSQDTDERTRQVFGVTTLDLSGKIILDGLLRRDESSLFGPDARTRWYYRASGAVRLPQLLEWNGGPSELRLRASYGTAGLRPSFFAQYEVLQASGGTFIKNQLGNRLLRPAHSGEFEVGFNAEFWNGRFNIEYNYSDKKTRDEIVQAPLLATTGFASQWQNIGALQAKTHEVAIGLQLVNTRDMALQLNLTGSRVREYITDWPLPSQVFGGTGDWAGFQYETGIRLGTMAGIRWVHNLDQLYLDPAKAAANGAGEAFDPAKYEVNYDGYLVEKVKRGTSAEIPIAMVACRDAQLNPVACAADETPTGRFLLGVASPDFRIGFNPNFSYKRFTIGALLDWNYGGQIANVTAHWATQDCADVRCDQSAKPADQRITEGFYSTGQYAGAAASEAFVENASFLKVRELSVNYTVSHGQLQGIGLGRILNEVRVGLIGRNLATITKYSGFDPEMAPAGDDPFKGRSEWFQYPPFRTITGFIEIAF
ncbi:MAG TPA: SusC/RagA family TonB-linked outer membrane protein [Gemmatimonadales bacterium]|nr:SusC/RagA family TonB-linked outer membrane protein [Gemmatimonadales bacterium]